MRKLSHCELVARQLEQTDRKLPITVIANNIRSLYNVGSIFRTCDGAGIEKLWLCGITGCPPNLKISKTALGAEEKVDWDHSWNVRDVVKSLRKKGYKILLLEQTSESIPFQDYQPDGPVAVVIGNEIDGVSDQLIDLSDSAVEIEMAGLKNSLNVTVAFGIVVYHIRNCIRQRALIS